MSDGRREVEHFHNLAQENEKIPTIDDIKKTHDFFGDSGVYRANAIGVLLAEIDRLQGELQSAQQEIERLKENLDDEKLASNESLRLLNETKRRLNDAGDREQKLIEEVREVYALIENVEDYANVKYARDEIERLLKGLGVTE